MHSHSYSTFISIQPLNLLQQLDCITLSLNAVKPAIER